MRRYGGLVGWIAGITLLAALIGGGWFMHQGRAFNRHRERAEANGYNLRQDSRHAWFTQSTMSEVDPGLDGAFEFDLLAAQARAMRKLPSPALEPWLRACRPVLLAALRKPRFSITPSRRDLHFPLLYGTNFGRDVPWKLGWLRRACHAPYISSGFTSLMLLRRATHLSATIAREALDQLVPFLQPPSIWLAAQRRDRMARWIHHRSRARDPFRIVHENRVLDGFLEAESWVDLPLPQLAARALRMDVETRAARRVRHWIHEFILQAWQHRMTRWHLERIIDSTFPPPIDPWTNQPVAQSDWESLIPSHVMSEFSFTPEQLAD